MITYLEKYTRYSYTLFISCELSFGVRGVQRAIYCAYHMDQNTSFHSVVSQISKCIRSFLKINWDWPNSPNCLKLGSSVVSIVKVNHFWSPYRKLVNVYTLYQKFLQHIIFWRFKWVISFSIKLAYFSHILYSLQCNSKF